MAKIAENGNTVPGDRIYFLYNHFNKALDGQAEQMGASQIPSYFQRNVDLDRYTLGVEKTLFSPYWSVELRLPFFAVPEVDTPIMSYSEGHVGNLAVIVKRLLYRSQSMAASVGLGIDTPTGSNCDTTLGRLDLSIQNDATHLMPYFALLGRPTKRVFFQTFLQVDVPTNGDRVHDYNPLTGENGLIGSYREQTLLYADLEMGYWLYRNPCACRLTGLAAVLEFHYTGTLQDTHCLAVPTPSSLYDIEILDPANRVNVVNMTVGLHGELARNTLVRVAGVFPLSSGDNRCFDGELQVQLERRF